MAHYRNVNTDQVIEADGQLASRLEALDNWEPVGAEHDGGDVDWDDADAVAAQLAELAPAQRNTLRDALTRFTDDGPSPFDPAEHSVAEITVYLDGADDAERERVLKAEAAGKARAGVLAGPHAAPPQS